MIDSENSNKSAIFFVSIILSVFLPVLPAISQEAVDSADSSAGDPVAVFVPEPPRNVTAVDHNYDRGENVDVSWDLSVDDTSAMFLGYDVYRRAEGEGEFKLIGTVPAGVDTLQDRSTKADTGYVYKVVARTAQGEAPPVITERVVPDLEMVNFKLWNVFLIGLFVSGAVIFFISHAKRGKKLFIRKIAGLEAIDDAIGRATEMGRSILFIPGINDMDDVQTIAGITILGRVARVVADYEISINMPVARSIVLATARETIKEAYASAGRPDSYNDDMVRYITDEQFGYVAAVDGIMVRDKPATCFYLGAFFAESLILAETGNSIGAIQIAGTAMPAQLPFFVAACDFTLIGEELFAASAYLSNEPRQLGSLKGQDVGKLAAMVAIALGMLGTTFVEIWDSSFVDDFNWFIHRLFSIVS